MPVGYQTEGATNSVPPTVFGEITFAGAGNNTTRVLKARSWPGLNAWFLQTAGAGVVTITLQFAQGQGPGNVIVWVPLVPDYALAFNAPSLQNFQLGSRFYRALLTTTGAATVGYRLGSTTAT